MNYALFWTSGATLGVSRSCAVDDVFQQWVYDADTKQISLAHHPQYCISVGRRRLWEGKAYIHVHTFVEVKTCATDDAVAESLLQKYEFDPVSEKVCLFGKTDYCLAINWDYSRVVLSYQRALFHRPNFTFGRFSVKNLEL